ncbi:hypothetical protein SF148580_1469 [Shigella flexneri 1485-80]|uniref:hypothetical protein n=1 Tax=Shigella flexneri TaxID=623 RepID=UPI0002831D55|nr:hypothetical protein [Shigella flexneri]EJZ67307.1 hypothetical protein SF148580_1469 [Shigella flexneri 1485-80]
MINPTLTLKDKALAGAMFLRNYAAMMADTDNPMMVLSVEPHLIAADAIEQVVQENTCLRNQLATLQTAADPAKESAEHTCHTTFIKGTRVCLKNSPQQRGTVVDTRTSSPALTGFFVRFRFPPFEEDRWVKTRNLEITPDK